MNANELTNKSSIYDLKQIRPMLAGKGRIEDLWDDPNWVAEEKIDGARYILQKNKDEWSCTSRTVSRATGKMVDKIQNVPHMITKKNFMTPQFIMDGEMQHDDFSKTVSIMGSKPERAASIQDQSGPITYYAFDLLEYNYADMRNVPYLERRKRLEHLVKSLNNPHIKVLPLHFDNKLEVYEDIIRNGGEGVILKHIDSKYVDGDRTKEWLKVKKHFTDDVVITGGEPSTELYNGNDTHWSYFYHKSSNMYRYEEDACIADMVERGYVAITKGHYHGWINAFTFGKYDADGNIVELGRTAGIPDRIRDEVSNGIGGIKVEYYGKCIEIGAMEKLKSGKYRHSSFLRFRPDKDGKDCLIEDNN